MTNYNERLEEILNEHWRATFTMIPSQKRADKKAKQALTSLIKELVEGAKPELRPTHIPTHGENTARLNAVWNMAIARYKQNLLKALEEV